jgi:hypothetical protein
MKKCPSNSPHGVAEGALRETAHLGRRTGSLFLAVALLALAFPVALAAQTNLTAPVIVVQPQNQSVRVGTSRTNGVKLEITVPTPIQSGRVVELTIKLSNTSPRAIYFGEINGVCELNIRVVNSNKVAPERTPLGNISLGGHSLGGTWSYITKVLWPGRSHEWHVDLNTLFKLVPGTYYVSVSIQVNRRLKPFTISVEGIEFAIQ